MTSEEREDLRQKVQLALLKGEEDEAKVLGPLQLESALATMEKRIYPPYAVMGSTVMDPSVAGVWPIRKYPWYVNPGVQSIIEFVQSTSI